MFICIFNFQLPVVDPFVEKVSLSDLGEFTFVPLIIQIFYSVLRLVFWGSRLRRLSMFCFINNTTTQRFETNKILYRGIKNSNASKHLSGNDLKINRSILQFVDLQFLQLEGFYTTNV